MVGLRKLDPPYKNVSLSAQDSIVLELCHLRRTNVSTRLESAAEIYARVLTHLLERIRQATVWDEPFLHTYFEDLFPADVYAALLAHLPEAKQYGTGPRDPNGRHLVRGFYNLTTGGISRFPESCRNLWRGVTVALTDPQLKRCVYAKFALELSRRYGVEETKVPDLAGHARPTLYRDIEGFEIPAHPDTLKKVVTMHLYLPTDLSQLHLGTALYRRNSNPLSKSDWLSGFTKIKQFAFRPNSGYAFVVTGNGPRQSWHGCERLPPGAGVRNTLLNTFYADPRSGYSGYLQEAWETSER